jgi:4-diphosphocytidyl-2-C-methyl-D-erythritol kinase
MVSSFAPAKVNLFLHVTGKQPDGYHRLDSLAVFPAVGDHVTALAADELTLHVAGRFSAGLQADDDNLVLRAARALAPGGAAALTLEKNLPVASGIGGGSADAAAALRCLARLWGIDANLDEIALGLGADVPVCLRRAPMRMRGVGEVLSPAPKLPDFGMVLANPGVPVATQAVFRARAGGFSPPAMLPAAWVDTAAMAHDLNALSNDLQAPAISLAPVIGEVLAAIAGLPACLLARMSGSGATCFGLFPTPAAAITAAASLTHPCWWVWGGGLYEPAPGDL